MLRSISLSASRALLVDALRRWRELLITDLLARMLATIVLAPLVALLLRVCLLRSDIGVLSDQAILYFLADPIGIAGMILVAATAVAVAFLELGSLMAIAEAAADGRAIGVAAAFVAVLRRGRHLVTLGLGLIVRSLAIICPFALAVTALYLLLLRGHDINYYLADKPPRFWAAIALASVPTAAMVAVLFWKLVTWSLALPAVLFSGTHGTRALALSAEITVGHRRRIVQWLLSWLALLLLTFLGATAVSWLAGHLLVPRDTDELLWVTIGLAAFFLISTAGHWAVTFVASSTLAVMVVHMHREIHGLAPPHGNDACTGVSKPTAGNRRKVPSGRVLVTCGVLALMLSVGGTLLSVKNLHAEGRIEIIAHRGASSSAPENTLAAFERAIADRADWLELDVQETADGVVVVQHDSDFMKSAGQSLRVWEATAADLAVLDIGSRFGPEFDDQRVPTLAEVLELARGRAAVLIELKYYGHDQQLERRVVDLVEAAGMTPNVMVMSLNYEGVRKMAKLRPSWTYGVLSTVALGDLTRLDVGFLGVTKSVATSAFIRRVHRRGMKVYVWTVNDPIEMSRLMSRGVDGIITDEPALARDVQSFRAELTPLGRLALWMAIESGLLRDFADLDRRVSERDA